MFGTPSGADWLPLLEAVERPTHAPARAGRAHAVPGLGRGAVASAGEERWEELHARLHEWAALLRERGVARSPRRSAPRGLPGARWPRRRRARLTDLRHVGSSCTTRRTPSSWASPRWARGCAAASPPPSTRATRSAAAGWSPTPTAVQVLTIHRSKGLEFPIVDLPFPVEPMLAPRRRRAGRLPRPGARDARTLDVGLEGPDWPAHKPRTSASSGRGPAAGLRRADPRAPPGGGLVGRVVSRSRRSALGRLLFARGDEQAGGRRTPGDADAVARGSRRSAGAPGCVASSGPALRSARMVAAAGAPPSSPPPLGRELDRAGAARPTPTSPRDAARAAARGSSEPEEGGVATSPEAAAAAVPGGGDEPACRARVLPLCACPGRAPGPSCTACSRRRLRRRPTWTRRRAAAGVDDPPRGRGPARRPRDAARPVLGDRRLRDVARDDRSTSWRSSCRWPAPTSRRARLDARRDRFGAAARGDPLAGYAERLADPRCARRCAAS